MLQHFKVNEWVSLPPLWATITQCCIPKHQERTGCVWYDCCSVLLPVLQRDHLIFLCELNVGLQLQNLSGHVWQKRINATWRQGFLNWFSSSLDDLNFVVNNLPQVKILLVYIENLNLVVYWVIWTTDFKQSCIFIFYFRLLGRRKYYAHQHFITSPLTSFLWLELNCFCLFIPVIICSMGWQQYQG